MEPRNPLAPTQHPDEPTCSRPQRLIQSGLVALGWVVPWVAAVPQAPARPNATASTGHQAERRDVSFCLSFHLALLGPTGAHCLDGPTNLTCKENTL